MFCFLPVPLLYFANVVSSQDLYSDNLVIGNLRRREVIPLAHINNPYFYGRRRFFNANRGGDLKYRRSKSIRDFVQPDRTFELTESQIREAKIAENTEKLDNLENQLRWLTIDTDEGIDQPPNVVYIGPQ